MDAVTTWMWLIRDRIDKTRLVGLWRIPLTPELGGICRANQQLVGLVVGGSPPPVTFLHSGTARLGCHCQNRDDWDVLSARAAGMGVRHRMDSIELNRFHGLLCARDASVASSAMEFSRRFVLGDELRCVQLHQLGAGVRALQARMKLLAYRLHYAAGQPERWAGSGRAARTLSR